jgi:hypothetical protein
MPAATERSERLTAFPKVTFLGNASPVVIHKVDEPDRNGEGYLRQATVTLNYLFQPPKLIRHKFGGRSPRHARIQRRPIEVSAVRAVLHAAPLTRLAGEGFWIVCVWGAGFVPHSWPRRG